MSEETPKIESILEDWGLEEYLPNFQSKRSLYQYHNIYCQYI